MIPTLSIPSLSGTFGIPARLTLNPKMPKEPASPSRSDTRTERQYINYETNRQRNNKGQRTTTGIKHWGLGGWVAFAPVSCFFSWDTDAPRKPQPFIPAAVSQN